ncbi:MAG: hypothetical protein LBD24_07495 [Spirochaetaceae bacterium]|nr:hypothetical protein [Spirochaetaceae bacterium]
MLETAGGWPRLGSSQTAQWTRCCTLWKQHAAMLETAGGCGHAETVGHGGGCAGG